MSGFSADDKARALSFSRRWQVPTAESLLTSVEKSGVALAPNSAAFEFARLPR